LSSSRKISPELASELKIIVAAKKNRARFAPLYNKYYKQIYLFLLKKVSDADVAGDLTAQTFMKAMVNLKKYEFRGYPFSTWLYRIATNEANMYFRTLKKEVKVALRESDVNHLITSLDHTVDYHLQDVLVAALNDLDHDQTQLIEMRFFERLSFKEIGAIYGITEANAKVRTYRILEKLKKIITLNQEP